MPPLSALEPTSTCTPADAKATNPPSDFPPARANLALYGLIYTETGRRRLADLGRYKTGVGCLYIASLAEVDRDVLEGLIRDAFAHMQTVTP